MTTHFSIYATAEMGVDSACSTHYISKSIPLPLKCMCGGSTMQLITTLHFHLTQSTVQAAPRGGGGGGGIHRSLIPFTNSPNPFNTLFKQIVNSHVTNAGDLIAVSYAAPNCTVHAFAKMCCTQPWIRSGAKPQPLFCLCVYLA